MPHLLLFGATGAIGEAIAATAISREWKVTGVSRKPPAAPMPGVKYLALDPLGPDFVPALLEGESPYTAVCWAQGTNANDSVYDVDLNHHVAIYQANVVYILITLKALLDAQFLVPSSKLCVISSIWQNLAKQSKLSYCVSKAALQGLVLSASVDLARDGHLINAILPGALDTPMTRQNLAPEQIDRLSRATAFNRLPALADVANLACFLCSPDNAGITGQFIAADLGFSHTRLI